MREAVRRDLAEAAVKIEFEAPLSKYTSLRVGGPATALASPRNLDELAALLEICLRHGLETRVLGAGFNTLVLDAGFDGVLIVMRHFRGLEASGTTLRAEAGTSHSQITKFCIEHGLAGLEFGAGIPGTVGGWVAMNAGIGAREIKDVVLEVEWLAIDGSRGCAPRAELDFGYRHFRLPVAGAVITAARFHTEARASAEIRAEVDRLLDQRSGSQPLDQPSCGSVFKNPEGAFAGELIDSANLKGTRVGGAEISTLHANFIVNRGGATARDVIELIDLARDAVQRIHGVCLETEVQIVGREA
ncbi:MAG: UDP-N-acetylmuramate dehydrogenase [Myxococcota bacterium]|jgi:UDP-N-acetylmuramate dehydrogenase